MPTLQQLLKASAARHDHLCPRQVLGVRMGILAGKLLKLKLPQKDKRLLTIVETDGCALSGISAATGCWVERRTMRVQDYGKVAATFIDTHTEAALRIAPRTNLRQRVADYAPDAQHRWEAYLLGYQRMPDEELFTWQNVVLTTPLHIILSKPKMRANCQICGEEIMNERELIHEGSILCRACAGYAYYASVDAPRCSDEDTFEVQGWFGIG